jgi:hypothetical protein
MGISRSSSLNTASSGPLSQRRKATSAETVKTAVVERRIPTPRADLVIVKIGERYKREAVSPDERASRVLARPGKALDKPGTDRARIFKSLSGKPVFAYSIDPKDPSRFVREDVAGNQVVGRVVNGKFRAIKAV